MTADAAGFDLSAAYLRKAQGDAHAFMEGLAARLEGALPGRVEVERKRDGFFSRTAHVTALRVTADDAVLTLRLDHGRFAARRAKVVHGVTLSSQDMSVPAWLEALGGEVGRSGADAEATRTVLHDFLMS